MMTGQGKTRQLSAAIFLGFISLIFVATISAQKLEVIDAAGHSVTLTPAQIANLPHVTVEVSDHGSTARFEAVPLSAVLSTGGIQLGDTLRGARMTEAVSVEGADGYRVVFALAEIDPAFAMREIVLADKRDAKPLDAKEGPFRVVAPGDKRGARWVRQVTTLRVVVVK
jgi:hypothetical protein